MGLLIQTGIQGPETRAFWGAGVGGWSKGSPLRSSGIGFEKRSFCPLPCSKKNCANAGAPKDHVNSHCKVLKELSQFANESTSTACITHGNLITNLAASDNTSYLHWVLCKSTQLLLNPCFLSSFQTVLPPPSREGTAASPLFPHRCHRTMPCQKHHPT